MSLLGGVVQGRVDRLYTRRSSREEGFTRELPRPLPRCTNQFYTCLITSPWSQLTTPFYLANRNWELPAISTRTNATCERVYQVKHSMQKQCFLATTTELKSNEKKRQNTYRLLFTSAVRMLLLVILSPYKIIIMAVFPAAIWQSLLAALTMIMKTDRDDWIFEFQIISNCDKKVTSI